MPTLSIDTPLASEEDDDESITTDLQVQLEENADLQSADGCKDSGTNSIESDRRIEKQEQKVEDETFEENRKRIKVKRPSFFKKALKKSKKN